MGLIKKYRPGKFSEFVGNTKTIDSLTERISAKDLSGGILLPGPMGTGKTTLAHTTRKAVRCRGRNLDEEIEPCCQCSECKNNDWWAFPVEFNCATLTTEVLSEIKTYHYIGEGPLGLNIKIFDEFHMATIKMQEIFLKFLDDFSNILFIFCAINLDNIIDPFLQRVQTLRTYPPTLEELVPWLSAICRKENFTFETGALELIAQASALLPRGCLNLLEQTYYLKKDISIRAVEQALKFEGRFTTEKS